MSRHRFDHAAALALYIELDAEKRTYAEVARRVGVSETTIRRVARNDEWERRLREHGETMVAKALQTREERMRQTARIRQLAASRLEKRLQQDDITDDFVARVFADAAKQVRLDEGDATDHVEVAQVQAGFRETIEAAYQLAGAIGGAELQRQFRERLPGLVQERLALIGGDG